MSVTLYMSGKMKKLQTLPQITERAIKNGLRRGQNKLRTALGEEFRSRGVGRAMFQRGYRKGALKTILAREKVKKSGEVYEVGIKIKGIAAIVARGDRTKAHPIGVPGKILANPAAGFFARGRVNHPGSQMVRDDFTGRATNRTEGAFRSEVAKGMDQVAAMVNNG